MATACCRAAKDAGFDWVRQQIVWADYQQTPARIKWDRLDPVVNAASANGVKLILSIVRSPGWAGQNGGMPGDKFTFAGFMSQIASRYKGKVAAYEIWNEQNYAAESGGPVNLGQYVDLLQVGYSAVKYADPDAMVMTGGLTPVGLNDPNIAVNDVEYLQAVLCLSGRRRARATMTCSARTPAATTTRPTRTWPGNPGAGHCRHRAAPEGTAGTDTSFYFRRIEELREVMEAERRRRQANVADRVRLDHLQHGARL